MKPFSNRSVGSCSPVRTVAALAAATFGDRGLKRRDSAKNQPEFHGGRFTATPIHGYWNGRLAFIESMITLDYLRRHPALSSALPQPERFEQSALYPTQWSADYDRDAHRYTIAFSALVLR